MSDWSNVLCGAAMSAFTASMFYINQNRNSNLIGKKALSELVRCNDVSKVLKNNTHWSSEQKEKYLAENLCQIDKIKTLQELNNIKE